jgi:aryl-alcohol dehydrogenase-like predicted oxidoreductase
MTLPTRTLGRDGPAVSALGLGLMGMSDFYGPADRADSLATIHAAMEAGVTVFDTADFYGSGHNELLLAEAIRGRRERAFIMVKTGVLRDPAGGFIGAAYRPEQMMNALAQTLRRLGTDHVDLYQPARVPPDVPVEEWMGALARMVQAGWVRHIGLSEAGSATLRRAHAIHPVSALQIEYSLMSRGIEADILPTCRELGIAVVAYGVLSRGLLSGRVAADSFAGKRDFRALAPRFTGDNAQANLRLVDALHQAARQRGATPAQLAIAWVLAQGAKPQGADILPLVGARQPQRLAEALGALQLSLTPDDLAAIEAAVPAAAVAGARYDAHGMAMLDSERA